LEFKEAILDLYDTLAENSPEDTTKVGVTFRYQELPDVDIKLTFEEVVV